MTVNFDHSRQGRTGVAEVVLAGPKTTIDLENAIVAALEKTGPVLVTRIEKDQVETILKVVEKLDYPIRWDRYQRTAIIGNPVQEGENVEVAILSGGTSDQPIVEEINLSLRYFGIKNLFFSDIGVAGIHRHQSVLKKLENYHDIVALIVVAGNEGALFSVVSGQTTLPMIAVPTSIGYGFGGKGLTALQAALQSCSPGVVTVNIDNGFGAAAFVQKLRQSQS